MEYGVSDILKSLSPDNLDLKARVVEAFNVLTKKTGKPVDSLVQEFLTTNTCFGFDNDEATKYVLDEMYSKAGL